MNRRTRQARGGAGDGERVAGARRAQLADLAARLFLEQDLADAQQALGMAARQSGTPDPQQWPTRAEVEAAIGLRQRLFRAEPQAELLLRYRRAALAAMQGLASFDPRLVGAVLQGYADSGTPVQLQVFADDPDEVRRHLDELGVPYRQSTRVLQFPAGRRQPCDAYEFVADGVPFNLTVLPVAGLRDAPREAGTDRPQARANAAQLCRLLGDGGI